jgi:hypothetical protein
MKKHSDANAEPISASLVADTITEIPLYTTPPSLFFCIVSTSLPFWSLAETTEMPSSANAMANPPTKYSGALFWFIISVTAAVWPKELEVREVGSGVGTAVGMEVGMAVGALLTERE